MMSPFHRLRRKRPNIQEAESYLKKGIGCGVDRADFVSVAERRKRLEQLPEELTIKVNKHLPRSRSLELVVLKCHVLVEFMFDQFIDLLAFTEGCIESERFTFKQKEALVYMLGMPPNAAFFATVDLLNAVRNSVAHTLEIDREKIDQIIRLNSEDPESAKKLSDSQRVGALKRITKCMCWFILGAIETKHAIEGVLDRECGDKLKVRDPASKKS